MSTAERPWQKTPAAAVMSASESLLGYALAYAADRGWHVFPAPANGDKRSHKAAEHSNGRTWGATNNVEQIRRDFTRWPNANIGVVTGPKSGFFVVEADTLAGHAVDGIASLKNLEAEHGSLPATLTDMSPSGSLHYFWRYPDSTTIRNSTSKIGPGIDVLGDGGMVIVPPSLRPGVGVYSWLNDSPIVDAPAWLIELAMAGNGSAERIPGAEPEADMNLMAAALEVIPNADPGWDQWNRIGMATWKATAGSGFALFDAWSQKSKKYDARTTAKKWAEFAKYPPTQLGAGTILFMANEAQPGWQAAYEKAAMDDATRTALAGVEQFAASLPNTAAKAHDGDKPIVATPYRWCDPSKISPRDFLYGRHTVRKFLAGKVAQGGVGKSTLIVAETLAMVSGRNLLGTTPPRCLRVWLWNLEDPIEETQRKIQAAALHYGLAREDIEPNLFVDSGRDQKLVIAETTRDGARIVRPVVDSLIEQIVARQIDVLIIDPFVSSHRVAENSNDDMDLVAKQWSAVAESGNCAVELVHHSKKGELEKTVESSRGAIAITDACRSVQVLNRMTKEEAERAGVQNHRLYFRVYADKANLAPPLETSSWFRLENVSLGNGPHNFGAGGDEVGVVTIWRWPDAMDGITDADFEKVAAKIREGKWRENPQARDWVGHAVATALGLNAADRGDKAKILGMLKAWRAAGLLTVVEGLDEKYMEKRFVQVAENDEKSRT